MNRTELVWENSTVGLGLWRNNTWTTVAPEERTCLVYRHEQSNFTLSNTEVIGINFFWWTFFVPGVLLNLLTIIAILRKKTLRNVISNRYTVALALIDGTDILLVGLTVLTNLNTDGALSKSTFFCGVLMWLEQWLKYTSLGLLGVIAVDRYRMVNRAAKYMQNKRFRTSMALGLLLPALYIAFLCGSLKGTRTIVPCYDKYLLMCLTILGPKPELWLLTTVFPLDTCLLLALQLALMLAYSTIVYTLIRKYWDSKGKGSREVTAGRGFTSPRTPQQLRTENYFHRASTRSAEMMVAVCLSCILTSLPASLYNLLAFLFAKNSTVIAVLDNSGAYKWIVWFFHLSPAINPVIYAYFNTHLLTEIKWLLRCKSSPRILDKPSKIN